MTEGEREQQIRGAGGGYIRAGGSIVAGVDFRSERFAGAVEIDIEGLICQDTGMIVVQIRNSEKLLASFGLNAERARYLRNVLDMRISDEPWPNAIPGHLVGRE